MLRTNGASIVDDAQPALLLQERSGLSGSARMRLRLQAATIHIAGQSRRPVRLLKLAWLSLQQMQRRWGWGGGGCSAGCICGMPATADTPRARQVEPCRVEGPRGSSWPSQNRRSAGVHSLDESAPRGFFRGEQRGRAQHNEHGGLQASPLPESLPSRPLLLGPNV